MALLTFGSDSTSNLSALLFKSGSEVKADLALFNAAVKNDLVNGQPRWPDAFRGGLLYVPNRGVLKVRPGDYVVVDHFGWPILVAAGSVNEANSSWNHS